MSSLQLADLSNARPSTDATGTDAAKVGMARTMNATESHQDNLVLNVLSNRQSMQCITNYKCGQMPNVMATLPNIGGALCSMPQSLADTHYQMPCSNAAKTRNLLKFAGVPQTTRSISAPSGPKFTILWGHVEDILLLNKFFPIVDTCLSCEDIT